MARDLNGAATYYVFDGEKIARVEPPEAGTRDFYVQEGQSIYSPLVSVHDEAADAQYWYLFDALGSTMGLVDANGNLSGKLQYDAFGNVLAEENVPRGVFFKYVGAYQYMPEDFEDMMLLWHRWYDPTVGRFVGRDPDAERTASQLPGGAYVYAADSPANSVDATGTMSWAAIWQALLDFIKGMGKGVAVTAAGLALAAHYLAEHYAKECWHRGVSGHEIGVAICQEAWQYARGPNADVDKCYEVCDAIWTKRGNNDSLLMCQLGCDRGGTDPYAPRFRH